MPRRARSILQVIRCRMVPGGVVGTVWGRAVGQDDVVRHCLAFIHPRVLLPASFRSTCSPLFPFQTRTIIQCDHRKRFVAFWWHVDLHILQSRSSDFFRLVLKGCVWLLRSFYSQLNSFDHWNSCGFCGTVCFILCKVICSAGTALTTNITDGRAHLQGRIA